MILAVPLAQLLPHSGAAFLNVNEALGYPREASRQGLERSLDLHAKWCEAKQVRREYAHDQKYHPCLHMGSPPGVQ